MSPDARHHQAAFGGAASLRPVGLDLQGRHPTRAGATAWPYCGTPVDTSGLTERDFENQWPGDPDRPPMERTDRLLLAAAMLLSAAAVVCVVYAVIA